MKKCGEWIEFSVSDVAAFARKEFYAERVKRATVKISGLGLFYLYINGDAASDDLFVPAWTDYHKRPLDRIRYPINDTFTHRIYYLEYDVTSMLKDGKNALAVMLGNGWYNQYRRTAEGHFEYGCPRLFFELDLELSDGEHEYVVSDGSVKWSEGFIRSNCLYYGETQDLRLYSDAWKHSGFDDSEWKYAALAREYEFAFEKQPVPADKKIREIIPVCIADYGQRRIYDMGENTCGWVKIKLTAERGESVILRFSEEICKGEKISLDFHSAGRDIQIQTDEFISDGEERVVTPYFSWHGFRYFEILGSADVICGEVVHTPLDTVGEFSSDNETLNWFFDAYVRSQLTNVHMSVPSDCPHRERLGYTGDGQITADSAMTVFDSEEFYNKWIVDILDCQDTVGGHIQHTAPFSGGGGGPGGWGCAVVVVPYMHYKHYRKIEILRKTYPAMCKWIGYMQTRCEEGIVTSEEPGGWCLGDWPKIDGKMLSESFVNTCYLAKSLMMMKEICTVTGDSFDYEELLESTKDAIKKHFFDESTGSFSGGEYAADAFALDIGIGDERTLENLKARYADANEFDTGIFGTEILIRVLFEYDLADIALGLLCSEGENSFYTMKSKGATTLHEHWCGRSSHNHPMFGGAVAVLFEGLAGIRYGLSGEVYLNPKKQGVLKSFTASTKTPKGQIRVVYSNGIFEINSPVSTYMFFDGEKYIITKGDNVIKVR